ncbi:NXPE family member 4-like isoform X2 [Lethenteron reissneri]|nr:NXPE family member 4-like isoform X2 [Lethenteron reissneri]
MSCLKVTSVIVTIVVVQTLLFYHFLKIYRQSEVEPSAGHHAASIVPPAPAPATSPGPAPAGAVKTSHRRYELTRWDLPVTTNLSAVSSAQLSVVTVVSVAGRATATTTTTTTTAVATAVGDSVLLRVEMRDGAGRPKRHGGDFLAARVHNVALGAAASGVVTDNGDGSYAVELVAAWPGEGLLEVTMVNPSEAVGLLERVRESLPDKVSFWGLFESGRVKAKAACHVLLNASGEVCDYTDPELGEPWLCEKPPGLPCHSLRGHWSYNKYPRIFADDEKRILSREYLHANLPVSQRVQAVTAAVVAVAVNGSREKAQGVACVPGMGNPTPSGHYFNHVWRSVVCDNRPFDSPAEVRKCLRHKEVIFLGDSTIRQWWEYLNSFVKELKVVDLGKHGRQDPRMALDGDNSILMTWHCHTYPLITSFFTHKEEMIYTAKRIDATVGGANTVIGICLGAHFTAFPLDVFRRRIGNIAAAVDRLLARSPRTKVVVKLANTCTPGSLEIFNNWNTFRMNRITVEAFAGLRVAFVDAWDMTLSAGSKNIHPDRSIVKNQVDLFLSYVC